MRTTATLAIPAKRSMYEKIVLNLMAKMTQGYLEVTMPSGEEITIGDGRYPLRADIKIRSNAFFKKVVLYGDIGFGEAYTEGLWDTSNISNVISWFLLNIENAPTVSGSKAKTWLVNLLKIANRFTHSSRENTISGSKRNIVAHYDLSNDFFKLFLDDSMTYSSAFFAKNSDSLRDAQINKYEKLAQKMKLKPNEHVLEIGCGWGSMSIYMAQNYDVYVTGVTISDEQYELATQRVKEAGLEERVNIVKQDYRTIQGEFDKIVSIEMLEAVGHKYLPAFFEKIEQLLKPDGLAALQVITAPDSRYDSMRKGVDWIQKHIFPGSLLPSVGAMNKAMNKNTELTLVNLEEMGLHYGRTLNEWAREFNNKVNQVKLLGFDDYFVRKWNYYLKYCEAAFNMRNINVMQFVYSRPNNLNM